MTARLFISPSRQLIFLALHYLVFTRQLVTLQTTPGDNSNAKSVSPLEGPKNMVNPDQVKAVIDGENSLTNKNIQISFNRLGQSCLQRHTIFSRDSGMVDNRHFCRH
uniref:Uncharacterized protein n=1 Tax=Cacopsylla melanoneura TaxID=428564 RepID=A0A8D9FF15_9HEMI